VEGRKQSRQMSTAGVGDLESWPSFVDAAQQVGAPQAKLWGCLLHAVDQETQEVEDWALVSTCPFSTGWQAYTTWRQRWHIENTGFREFKEGWHVEAAPWTHDDDTVAWGRVTFTAVAFNVAQVAKTASGRRLIQVGIRRLRRKLTQEIGPAPVIVFTKDAYGVFDIEEIVTALGRPPRYSVRRPRTAGSRQDRSPP